MIQPPAEELLLDPSPPYSLDPNRGVQPDLNGFTPDPQQADVVMADSVVDDLEPGMPDSTLEQEADDRILTQANEAIAVRNSLNPGYDLRNPTDSQVFATLSIKAARKLSGAEISDKATIDELKTCIQKDV